MITKAPGLICQCPGPTQHTHKPCSPLPPSACKYRQGGCSSLSPIHLRPVSLCAHDDTLRAETNQPTPQRALKINPPPLLSGNKIRNFIRQCLLFVCSLNLSTLASVTYGPISAIWTWAMSYKYEDLCANQGSGLSGQPQTILPR